MELRGPVCAVRDAWDACATSWLYLREVGLKGESPGHPKLARAVFVYMSMRISAERALERLRVRRCVGCALLFLLGKPIEY